MFKIPETPIPRARSEHAKKTKLSYINDGWADTEAGPSSKSTTEPSGLVLYILDITSSMFNMNEALSTSSHSFLKILQVVDPCVAHAIITYTDFDKISVSKGHVLEVPNSEGWVTGDQFAEYLDSIEVTGGGKRECEALDFALWYALKDFIPAFKKRYGLSNNNRFPVLIFVLTDEDMRLCDTAGNYGKVVSLSTKSDLGDSNLYSCLPDSQEECQMSSNVFRERWHMSRPPKASDFRHLILKNNCWLRVIKYGNDCFEGLQELCRLDDIHRHDNDRWQLFISLDVMGHWKNMYDLYRNLLNNLVRFIVVVQERFFRKTFYELSAIAVLERINGEQIDKYVRLGILPDAMGLGVNPSQMEDFEERFMDPQQFNMSLRRMPKETDVSKKFLLSNHFDSASTCLAPIWLESIKYSSQDMSAQVRKLSNGGIVASYLAAHVDKVTKVDIASEEGLCTCEGCKNLLGLIRASKNRNERKCLLRYHTKLYLARTFTKLLFGPMVKDEVMMHACRPIKRQIRAIREFVFTENLRMCGEVNRVFLSSQTIVL
nr:MAG: wsv465-like protein [Metapenaeus ensis nimavirus]